MKKVLVFEQVVYHVSLEKIFYNFCLMRQFSLVKYLFMNSFFAFLFFFWIISKRKYYEKRWDFLHDVIDLEEKISVFWKSKRKKLSHLASEGELVWISEYPEILLKGLAKHYQADLFANKYNLLTNKFSSYETINELFEKLDFNESTMIYDRYDSKVKNKKSAHLVIVHNGRTFTSSRSYWIYRILLSVYTSFMLLMMALCLGFISMYFGAAYYFMPMFRSYFQVDYLAFLNLFPVLICIFLFYFIFNRVWVSFLLTSIVILGLTWINYFKLLIRNDPLLAVDINLFFESMDMAGKYEIDLNWKIISVLIACVLGTVWAYFFVKGKIQSLRLRAIGIIATILISTYSFNQFYMNKEIYASTENFDLINRWSATQLYISKGFLYPFIYSIQTTIDRPPEGYAKENAEERLYSYKYSDIPDDKKVHVISIMLEAYNDFSKFEQIEFNKDVYKALHDLQEEGYSGELVTNIFAGGTIDTERSFLTGYTSLTNFRTNVNSYVRYFEEQNYAVEGSHPSYDWFYNRKNVNEYLGFNDYYFFENKYSELADGQIAKDEILFPEIIRLYEANKKTGQPYFSFNVTYQNHGPYSTETITDTQYVKNKGYSEGEYNILNNYFAGVYDTNNQLRSFIDYFRKDNEPV